MTILVHASEEFTHYWGHPSVTFTITEPEPFLTSQLASASIVVSAAAVSFGLLAYFVKLKRKRSDA